MRCKKQLSRKDSEVCLMEKQTILAIKDLHVRFNTAHATVQAIRGIDFDLYEGETFAIVGESGSGKSVTTKAITGLLPEKRTSIPKGEILYNGMDLTKLSEKQLQGIRGKEIAMVFQDPMTSLSPTMKIRKQITEPLIKHLHMSKEAANKRALELLQQVGIRDAEKRLEQYPHELSGGMRQRVVIAIAISCNPKILIADEPTTALDVTIQAQILELLKQLQHEMNMTIIFITHDLGVVANIADRVGVMYAGKLVEIGKVDEIFYNPQHPYTWGLIGSMPTLDMAETRLAAIPGSPPDLANPPLGDAFATRNPFALQIDFEEQPPFFTVSPTHRAATWLLHEDAPKVELPAEIARRKQIFATIGGNE